VKLQFIGLLAFGLLAWGTACADAPNGSSGFPAPGGFKPCAPDSPLAIAEARIATKLGGEFLGCFQSERETMAPSSAKAAPTPVEYAFAIALQGGGHTPADLDNLLSTVKHQWKDFDPLSKEFKETYTARVNELIKGSGLTPSPTMVSEKPVLVSIDRAGDSYYSVTSLRTYTVELNGERVMVTKVNSGAVALRGSQLIRLTIQRTLSDPTDVTQVQGEITDWARATAQGVLPKGR
jgi:hypothetical protein